MKKQTIFFIVFFILVTSLFVFAVESGDVGQSSEEQLAAMQGQPAPGDPDFVGPLPESSNSVAQGNVQGICSNPDAAQCLSFVDSYLNNPSLSSDQNLEQALESGKLSSVDYTHILTKKLEKENPGLKMEVSTLKVEGDSVLINGEYKIERNNLNQFSKIGTSQGNSLVLETKPYGEADQTKTYELKSQIGNRVPTISSYEGGIYLDYKVADGSDKKIYLLSESDKTLKVAFNDPSSTLEYVRISEELIKPGNQKFLMSFSDKPEDIYKNFVSFSEKGDFYSSPNLDMNGNIVLGLIKGEDGTYSYAAIQNPLSKNQNNPDSPDTVITIDCCGVCGSTNMISNFKGTTTGGAVVDITGRDTTQDALGRLHREEAEEAQRAKGIVNSNCPPGSSSVSTEQNSNTPTAAQASIRYASAVVNSKSSVFLNTDKGIFGLKSDSQEFAVLKEDGISYAIYDRNGKVVKDDVVEDEKKTYEVTLQGSSKPSTKGIIANSLTGFFDNDVVLNNIKKLTGSTRTFGFSDTESQSSKVQIDVSKLSLDSGNKFVMTVTPFDEKGNKIPSKAYSVTYDKDPRSNAQFAKTFMPKK